jgi:hypothetical protein
MNSIAKTRYTAASICMLTVGAAFAPYGCSTTAVGPDAGTPGGSSSSGGSSSGVSGSSSSGSSSGVSGSSSSSSGGAILGCFGTPGRCTPAATPLITNFDNYTTTTVDGAVADPTQYTFYVNAMPPAANALLGALLYINDGDGTPMLTMGTGYMSTYAAQFGTTTPVGLVDGGTGDFGGFLELYFPATIPGCIDATGYHGISFWAQGTSGAQAFGVSVGTVESVDIQGGGLCDDTMDAAACKDFTAKYTLPTTWTQFQVPWTSFTGGMVTPGGCAQPPGSGLLRIQFFPYELYPAPTYTISPMPYSMSVDDIELY